MMESDLPGKDGRKDHVGSHSGWIVGFKVAGVKKKKKKKRKKEKKEKKKKRKKRKRKGMKRRSVRTLSNFRSRACMI